MITLRYPLRTLLGDDLRAATGVGIGAGVLSSNPVGWPLGLVFGGILVVFGGFGLRTLRNHMLRVRPIPEGLTRTVLFRRSLAWTELTAVKLRYYGTRRHRTGEGIVQNGFMQLILTGPHGRMTYESSLEGFDYLVWRAARAARETGLGLDPGTAGNMLNLDIDPDGETRPPSEVRNLAAKIDGIAL